VTGTGAVVEPRARPGDFGQVLGRARVAAGLTQEELAAHSGLSVRAIRNLETGVTDRPRKQSVRLLGRALGLPAADVADLLRRAGWNDQADAQLSVRRTSELPPDARELVGRAESVAELCRLISEPDRPGVPRLAAVTGPPGSGRTAVVSHVAHRLRAQFPDGQVYVDLDQLPGARPTAAALTTRLLRSFRIFEPAAGVEEQAARARALLESHRVVVVLDNITSEAQVRPLLTASVRSAVLVAARGALPALAHDRMVRLPALTAEQSALLFSRLVGRERAMAEFAAVRRITAHCEHLPLALHIAGLWLVARPHRRLRELADRLANEQVRLDTLTVGDLSLAASVRAFLDVLPPPDLTALCRLGRHRGEFELSRAAAVLGLPVPAATILVEEWEMAQLVMAAPSRDGAARYRVHDMVRLCLGEPSGAAGIQPNSS
jgi:transcriptional regulator with XRE-family HTH domain